jgi:membrane fusion protein, multidrug efflux system
MSSPTEAPTPAVDDRRSDATPAAAPPTPRRWSAAATEAPPLAGPSTPAAAASATETSPVAPPVRSGRRRIVFAIVALAALALTFLGVRHLLFARTHVTSDNAQVEGHVIPILPRVSGYVAEVRVQENERVQQGDLLVRIDDRDLRSRLAQAESDLATALATAGTSGSAGQAPAQLQSARAAVAQARANEQKAENDLSRYQPLADRNIISRQTLDAAEAAAGATRAQLAAAQEQVIAASAGVRGAEGRAGAMRAARDQATLQLSFTAITAPAAGVVTKKSVEVGQLVQAGQPLMSVVPLDDVWVVANLKETEVRNITPGNPVEIEVDSYPGRKFKGHVESLSPATGARFSLLPPDNATGNFTKVVQRIPVRIRLDGAPDPAHPLRPGMSARVAVTTR